MRGKVIAWAAAVPFRAGAGPPPHGPRPDAVSASATRRGWGAAISGTGYVHHAPAGSSTRDLMISSPPHDRPSLATRTSHLKAGAFPNLKAWRPRHPRHRLGSNLFSG